MAAASATLGSVSQLALSAGLVSMVTGALFYGSGMLADEGDGGPGPGRSGPST